LTPSRITPSAPAWVQRRFDEAAIKYDATVGARLGSTLHSIQLAVEIWRQVSTVHSAAAHNARNWAEGNEAQEAGWVCNCNYAHPASLFAAINFGAL